MENASKALLIAGAILLVILIISLGLMVYNQAKDTVGNTNLTQQEIEAFNSKFTSYEGTNISASQVNALLQTAISANAALAAEDSAEEGIYISSSGGTTAVTSTSVAGSSALVSTTINYSSTNATVSGNARVATGQTYTVQLVYSNTGKVCGAVIN